MSLLMSVCLDDAKMMIPLKLGCNGILWNAHGVAICALCHFDCSVQRASHILRHEVLYADVPQCIVINDVIEQYVVSNFYSVKVIDSPWCIIVSIVSQHARKCIVRSWYYRNHRAI